MEGYLYVENNVGCLPSDVYTQRYFISFPFCGLKWFADKPAGESRFRYLFEPPGPATNWVFGGHVAVYSVQIEPCKPVKVGNSIPDVDFGDALAIIDQTFPEEVLYPFTVQIVHGNNSQRLLTLRFASESESDRYEWITELRECEIRQAFVNANVEHDSLPSLDVYESVRTFQDTVTLRDLFLRTKSFASITSFLVNRGSYGLTLRSIVLDNVRLHDQQLKQLSAILNISTNISEVSLADNFLTCKGVVYLADSVSRSKDLVAVNLSGNYIADEGAELLCQSLGQCPRLTSIDLSRNRLTSASARPFTLHVATHFSKLKYLDLSFNSMGDDAAAIAGQLMIHPQPVIETVNLAHCGIGPRGALEVALAVGACTSLRRLNLRGNHFDRQSLSALLEALNEHPCFRRTAVASQSSRLLEPTASVIVGPLGELLLEEPVSQALTVDVGGLFLSTISSTSVWPVMDVKTAKQALFSLPSHTLVQTLVLQRQVIGFNIANPSRQQNQQPSKAGTHHKHRDNQGFSEAKAITTNATNPNNIAVMVQKSAVMADGRNAAFATPKLSRGFSTSEQHTLDDGSSGRSALAVSFVSSSLKKGGSHLTVADLSGSSTRVSSLSKPSQSQLQSQSHPMHSHHYSHSKPQSLVPTDVKFYVCARIALPDFLNDEHDFLSALALSLQAASTRQLRLLSNVEYSAATRAGMVVFTIDDLPASDVEVSVSRVIHEAFAALPAFALSAYLQSAQRVPSSSSLPPSSAIPSAIDGTSAAILLRRLQDASANSVPALRMLGVSSVFVQILSTPTSTSGAIGIAQVYQYAIQHTCRGGRGAYDYYLPPVAPDPQFLKDIRSQFDIDTDDDDNDVESLATEEDDGSPYWPSALSAAAAMSPVDGHDINDENDDDNSDHSSPDPRAKYSHQQRPIKSTSTAFTGKTVTADSEMVSFAFIAQQIRELRHEDTKRRLEFGTINKRLVFTARRLFAQGDITKDVAKFWEGAVGNRRYARVVREAANSALLNLGQQDNSTVAALNGNGVFRTFAVRRQLCEAMIRRDITSIRYKVEELKSLMGSAPVTMLDRNHSHQRVGAHHADLTIHYAERLLTELQTLKHTAKTLFTVAVQPSDLTHVEEFLLHCGRLGYHDAVTATGTGGYVDVLSSAVALRQQLVARGLVENPLEFSGYSIDLIRKRAFLSNLMISRDMDGLAAAVDEIDEQAVRAARAARAASKDPLMEASLAVPPPDYRLLNEYSIAVALLEDYRTTTDDMHDALHDKDASLAVLEDVMATAAFHNFYDEVSFKQMMYKMLHLSDDPVKHLLSPIVSGIRRKDDHLVQDGMIAAYRAGWVHPAVDKSVIEKLVMTRDKIEEEEHLKAELVDMALQVRNGEAISSLEMIPVVRKATVLGWRKDEVISPYLATLEKNMKKVKPLSQIETEVQQMIAERDIPALINFLAGRSSHVLVVSAPALQDMQEWYTKLLEVCEGKHVHHSGVRKAPVLTGTLEKAARRNDGKLRFWKKRYFVLHGRTLTYGTSAKGVVKGVVRVVGGAIRLMSASESAGKPFCIELQEGIDLKKVDNELIDQATQVVRAWKKASIEHAIRYGITRHDMRIMETAMSEAKAMKLNIDSSLLAAATISLLRLKTIALKVDMRRALVEVPTAQLEGYLVEARAVGYDSSPLFQLVATLFKCSEVQQSIMRLRGCLVTGDDAAFRRTFAYVCRHDLSRFSIADNRQLATTIMQHTGMIALRSFTDGESIPNTARMLAHALAACGSLYVETGPMQLARLIVQLATPKATTAPKLTDVNEAFAAAALRRSDPPMASIVATGGDSTSSVSHASQYLDTGLHLSQLNSHLSLERFPGLRDKPAAKEPGMLQKLLGLTGELKTSLQKHGRGQEASLESHIIFNERLVFTLEPLKQSLLAAIPPSGITSPVSMGTANNNSNNHSNEDAEFQHYALEAFEMLKVIMGDRTMPSMWKSMQRKKHVMLPPQPPPPPAKPLNIADLTAILINAAATMPHLRDELYVQLCKQLTTNGDIASRLRAWLLFSLYLHGFHPSEKLVPYLKNFMTCSLGVEVELHLEKARRSSMASPSPFASGLGDTTTVEPASNIFASIAHTSTAVDISDPYGVKRAELRAQRLRKILQQKQAGNITEDDVRRFKEREDKELMAQLHHSISQLIAYSIKVINKIESYYAFLAACKTSKGKSIVGALGDIDDDEYGNDDTFSSASNDVVMAPSRQLIAYVYARAPLVLDVVLMTGSAYRFIIRYGDIDTPFSLLPLLLMRMMGGADVTHAMASYYDLIPAKSQQGASSAKGKDKQHRNVSHAWTDYLLKQFRGMAFYGIYDERTGKGEQLLHYEEEVSRRSFASVTTDSFMPPPSIATATDIDEILTEFGSITPSTIPPSVSVTTADRGNNQLFMLPIQPSESAMIDWDHDLLWDTISTKFKFGDQSIPYKKVLLRRRLGAASEIFTPIHEMFDEHDFENDIEAKLKLWSDWLNTPLPTAALSSDSTTSPEDSGSNGNVANKTPNKSGHTFMMNPVASKPLPHDFIRIDLLFAEESRYVNSRLYPMSDDSLGYLLAIQLTIDWEDAEINPLLWGSEGCDGVINDAQFSVRPCMPYNPRPFFYPKKASPSTTADTLGHNVSDSTVKAGVKGASKRAVSAAFRRSIVGGLDLGEVNESIREQSQAGTSSNDSNNSDADESEAEDGELMVNLYFEDESNAGGNDDGEEESVAGDAISDFRSDISSTIHVTKVPLLVSCASVTILQQKFIASKLKKLGIEIDPKDDRLMNFILYWLEKFHSMVETLQLENTIGPKFRYTMKRIYLDYLMTNPYYGHHFTDAEQITEGDRLRRPVVVTISAQGIHLLDPHDWAVILHAQLWDIEHVNVSLSQVHRGKLDSASEHSAGEGHTSYLSLDINGMPVLLKSAHAWDQYRMINAYALEALGRGIYPHGTEGGNDLVRPSASGHVFGSALSIVVPQSDPKEVLKRFLTNYPIAPPPPPMYTTNRHVTFSDVPRNQRQMLADERAEETEREKLAERMAAAAVLERLQTDMEAGKKVVGTRRYDTATSGDGDGDGSDGSENEGGESGKHTSSARKHKSISARKSRSLSRSLSKMGSTFGGAGGIVTLETRVGTAVCGVPIPRYYSSDDSPYYLVPEPPQRRGGLVQLHVLESKGVIEPPRLEAMLLDDAVPPLVRAAGFSGSITRPPVPLLPWNLPGLVPFVKSTEEIAAAEKKRKATAAAAAKAARSTGAKVAFDGTVAAGSDMKTASVVLGERLAVTGSSSPIRDTGYQPKKSSMKSPANELAASLQSQLTLSSPVANPDAVGSWNPQVADYYNRFNIYLQEEFEGQKIIIDHGGADSTEEYGGDAGVIRGRCVNIVKKLVADAQGGGDM